MHAQNRIDLHGVVSRADLLAAGMERGAIADRLKKGRLFRKYRGVYAVGRPDLNNGRELDATWPHTDLIVEVDSWKHHRHRTAFTIDRAKDRAALRAGRRTARFTGDELEQDAAGIAAELRVLLTV
jgi:hypothetical protein